MGVTTLATEFLGALAAGKACLHPTDTLPGLAFDPRSAPGRAAVVAIKGRDGAVPYLGLVASLPLARRFWQPLPPGWDKVLEGLWPGPLSVIWRASDQAQRSMQAADGGLGLRVPQLAPEAAWFAAVLQGLDTPLPTTSVNASGQAPIGDWAAAAAFLSDHPDCHVPALSAARVAPPAYHAPQPSTVIRVQDDGGFTLVRQGALPLAAVERLCRAEVTLHA